MPALGDVRSETATLPQLTAIELESVVPSREAARMLGLGPRTLEQWRVRGTGPRFIKLSANRAGYRLRDLIGWLAEREGGAR